MKKITCALLFFFNFIFAIKGICQNYYQIPGAYIQPQFAALLYFEDGNGMKDTLYFGFDNRCHDMPYYSDSDTLFGCRKVHIDTTLFYALWGPYVLCGNHLCDSVYKVNVSPLSSCLSPCFPSVREIYIINGVLPLKISWDVSVFRNDSIPFTNQSPAPSASGYLMWDYWGCFTNAVGDIYWNYILISDSIVNTNAYAIHSVTIYDPLPIPRSTNSGYLNFFVTPWTGILLNSENIKNNFEIQIYPNPTSEIIHIYSEQTIHNYKLFNQFSQIILYGRRVSSNNLEINLSNLQKGIYIIQLEIENNFRYKYIILI